MWMWLRACLVVGAAAFQAPARGLRAPPRAFVARDDDPRASDAARVAVLCSVPVVWGTYAPAVKAVYALPAPPPGAVFSLFYYVVVGLETVSADAAAFLVQLTTVLVPVLESAAAAPPSGRVGVRRGLSGVAVLCAEGLAADAGQVSGDLCVVAAAVLYSLHALAPSASALGLATAKAGWEAAFALGGVAFLALATPFEGAALPRGVADARGRASAAVLVRRRDVRGRTRVIQRRFNATCAYTIWAQSFGQRGVAPSRANLIYTSQPVFSALFAFGLLGERPTAATVAGGGLILAAVATELSRDRSSTEAASSALE
ncbi:hypothetical protein JL722_5840 [Aureococcus anophagefferens]|nr:hypothetical protein JL722_5840 [Aureococcus anophagefferens]